MKGMDLEFSDLLPPPWLCVKSPAGIMVSLHAVYEASLCDPGYYSNDTDIHGTQLHVRTWSME